jgi:hypothetical protein
VTQIHFHLKYRDVVLDIEKRVEDSDVMAVVADTRAFIRRTASDCLAKDNVFDLYRWRDWFRQQGYESSLRVEYCEHRQRWLFGRIYDRFMSLWFAGWLWRSAVKHDCTAILLADDQR